MPRIKLSLETLRRDFNTYDFIKGDTFMWSFGTMSIIHPEIRYQADLWSLLHEIAHAELRHNTYTTDVELVTRETQAWHYAAHKLAPCYNVRISYDYIEDHLDTYRYWLHKRSQCPTCHQNGFQTTQNTYNCSNCRCLWQVNEARTCRLQRIKLQDQSRFAEPVRQP